MYTQKLLYSVVPNAMSLTSSYLMTSLVYHTCPAREWPEHHSHPAICAVVTHAQPVGFAPNPHSTHRRSSATAQNSPHIASTSRGSSHRFPQTSDRVIVAPFRDTTLAPPMTSWSMLYNPPHRRHLLPTTKAFPGKHTTTSPLSPRGQAPTHSCVSNPSPQLPRLHAWSALYSASTPPFPQLAHHSRWPPRHHASTGPHTPRR